MIWELTSHTLYWLYQFVQFQHSRNVFLVHGRQTVNEIWAVPSWFVTPLSSLGPVSQVDTAMLELERPDFSEVFSAVTKRGCRVHRRPKNITTVLHRMLRKVAGKCSLTDASDVHGVASLGASAVTPSCLGQTWGSLPAFRSWEELAVWFGLDWPLTSLLRTTAPPLSTSATASPSLCLSVLSFPIGSQPVIPT